MLAKKLEPDGMKMAVNGNGRKVKGTFLIPLAKIINSRKDIDWAGPGKLTGDDLGKIKEKILASNWYDLIFFNRVSSAVYQLVAGGKPEGARQFGEGIMWDTLAEIYHSSLVKESASEALSRFASLYNGIFFNTGEVEFQASGTEARFRIFDPGGIPAPEFFIEMMKSLLKKIAWMNRAEQVTVHCEEGLPDSAKRICSADFHLRWEKR